MQIGIVFEIAGALAQNLIQIIFVPLLPSHNPRFADESGA
jgi:hypothetical protein